MTDNMAKLLLALAIYSLSAHAQENTTTTASTTSSAAGSTTASITTTEITSPSSETGSSTSVLASSTTSLRSNATVDPDQCWTSWSSWYRWAGDFQENYGETVATTYTDYDLDYYSTTATVVTTERNGAFPINTFTVTTAYETYSRGKLLSTVTVTPESTTPSCTLASSVSQCQASWDAYATANWLTPKEQARASPKGTKTRSAASKASDGDALLFTPLCTQAAITGSTCSQAYSSWYEEQVIVAGSESSGVLAPKKTIDLGYEQSTTYIWDPASTIAPGCSLGCQGCAVQGGTVQLLYWPPATSNAGDELNSPATTLSYSGTTLTYPTVYISFDQLYARDSCSVKGSTHSNTIIPITDTKTLSSLWGYNNRNNLPATASFNFTDLYVQPVPNSIYNSQIRCDSSRQDKWPHTPVPPESEGYCARTLPYEPIISMPMEVLQVDPAWATCTPGFNGVYDPPVALSRVEGIAQPTLPSGPAPTQTPDPGASPSMPVPQPTQPPTRLPEEGLPPASQASMPAPAAPSPIGNLPGESNMPPAPAQAPSPSDGQQVPNISPTPANPVQANRPGNPLQGVSSPAQPSLGSPNNPAPGSPSPQSDIMASLIFAGLGNGGTSERSSSAASQKATASSTMPTVSPSASGKPASSNSQPTKPTASGPNSAGEATVIPFPHAPGGAPRPGGLMVPSSQLTNSGMKTKMNIVEASIIGVVILLSFLA